MIFSLAWNTMFTDYWKALVLNFPEMGNTVFFEPKNWWKDYIYWLLENSCFELSWNGKYGIFLSLKNSGKMIFTDYWKVLVLNFLEMGNAVFFSSEKLIQKWYLLGLFELSKIFQDLENIVFCAVNFPTHWPPGNAKYQMIFLPSSLRLCRHWWNV